MSAIRKSCTLLRYIWHHDANNGKRIRAIVRAVAWQCYKRLGGSYWELRVWGGMRFRIYNDNTAASAVLYTKGYPDWDEMRFMQDYLQKGDRFLDIGANTGVYSIYAASIVGRSGKIEAFEPVPASRSRLSENVLLNRLHNVRIHTVAVGAKHGETVRLTTDMDTTNHVLSKDCGSGKFIEVEVNALDEVLNVHDRYAMGKIDIEGGEPIAFQGARRMLAECNPPVWLIEINGLLQRYGWSEGEFADWLEDAGYRLALYDSNAKKLCWMQRPWEHRNNIFAVARNQIPAVEGRLCAGL